MVNAWLRKDKQGFFTCGYCEKLFKPNPQSVLNYSSPDSVGVTRVFCSKDCAYKFMIEDIEATTEMQNYKHEFNEYVGL